VKRKKPPKPPPRKRGQPSGIGEILADLKKTTKLGKQLEQAKIWENWAHIAGPKLSLHGRPRTIKDGRLVVDVDTSVAMHRFAYRKFALMKRINSFAGKELVSDIYFQLAPEEAPETGE
jgi:predicted nucleic acid-binding Zn ribbon protein